MREAAPHYEENMKMFGELRLVRALTDEQIAAIRDPRFAGTVRGESRQRPRRPAGGLIEQLKAVRSAIPTSTASQRR